MFQEVARGEPCELSLVRQDTHHRRMMDGSCTKNLRSKGDRTTISEVEYWYKLVQELDQILRCSLVELCS